MRPESKPTISILVADDNPELRKMLSEMLRQEGYEVLTARDGNNALNIARKHEGKIDLLITDVMMPKVDGFDLREKILRERSDLKILVMSGNLDPEIAGEDFPLIRKPFKREDLMLKIKSILDKPAGFARP